MAGRGLGTLTLDLAIRMGAFTAGLDKAGRELDAKTRKMQKRAEAFGRALGTSIKVGFGIAATAMGIYIKNTIEAEKVQAQLTARIKDTAGAAGRSLQQLNAQATKLQGTTVFDDESIGEAQAALLTFSQVTGKVFDRTIEAATDLATVMGTDVADAARLLGKALSDPEKGLGALRKAGIVLTQQQAELVKGMQEAGDMAGAQGVILDALAGKMGSAAEAARDTLGGALQALTNSFNELLEGNGGDTGLRGTVDAINDLNATLNDPGVKRGVDNMVAGFAYIAERATLAASAIANLIAQNDAFGRSAGEAQYNSNLSREDILRAQIANGGSSPFEPGGRRTVETLKAELAVVHQLNEAYRAAQKSGRPVDAPAGTPQNDTIVVHGGAGFGKGGRSGGGASKQKTEAQELAEAFARVNAQMQETIALYNETGEAAKVRYEIEHGEYAKYSKEQQNQLLLNAQKQDQLAAEKEARKEQIRLEEDERKEAQAHADSVKKLLDDIAFETSLIGLNNDERERMIALRNLNGEATAGEAAQIEAAMKKLQESSKANAELTGAMDEFRGNFEDTVTDVLTGAKSIGEAFKSLADMVVAQIARIIAQQLTTSLFGAPGSTSGGSQSGLLSSLFSIFLPKHAAGTDFAPGGMTIVGERGPEIVNMPRGAQVIPNHKLGGGSIVININGHATRETAQQTANEVRRVLAFSGRSG